MASLARRIIAANGLETVVRVIGKRSSDTSVAAAVSDADDGALQQQMQQQQQKRGHQVTSEPPVDQPDMDRKADVLVTEIFDSELLGEGLLPTLRDAIPRLLKVLMSPALGPGSSALVALFALIVLRGC